MDLILNLTIVTIAAIVSGAVVGLVPGLTPLIGLMLVMPVIANFSVPEIVTFWMCFLSVSQYYGSVGALLLKVPGETSSLPVLVASKDFKLAKSVLLSYRLTAFSSYVASLVGIVLVAGLLIALKDSWYLLFSLKFTIFFLSVTFILLLTAKKQYWLNALFVLFGLFVAWFPESDRAVQLCASTSWACFALNPADFNLVIISLYVVPYLLEKPGHFAQRKTASIATRWRTILRFRYIALKHALVGFVVGFTPGMGVTLSSNLAANLELAKNEYHRLKAMAAAESANNSSAISCAIPFLFIGLPITGTELFLDNWLRVFKSYDVNYELLYKSIEILPNIVVPYYVVLLATLLAVCSICFVLTSRFVTLYQSLTMMSPKVFDLGIKTTIISITIYSLLQAFESGVIVPIGTLVVFSLIGIWAYRKHFDIIALPVTIVIGRFAIDKFITAYNLWS